ARSVRLVLHDPHDLPSLRADAGGTLHDRRRRARALSAAESRVPGIRVRVAALLAASDARALGEAPPGGAVAQERPGGRLPSSMHHLLRPGRGHHPGRDRLHRRGLRVLGVGLPTLGCHLSRRRRGAAQAHERTGRERAAQDPGRERGPLPRPRRPRRLIFTTMPHTSMRRTLVALALTLVLIASVLLPAARASAQQAPLPIKIGYQAVASWLLFGARSLKLYEK